MDQETKNIKQKPHQTSLRTLQAQVATFEYGLYIR